MGVTMCLTTITNESLARMRDEPGATNLQTGNTLDLHKAYYGIHCLLSNDSQRQGPETTLLTDKGFLFDEDPEGWGAVRGFTAEETRAFAEVLACISPEDMSVRFDLALPRERLSYGDRDHIVQVYTELCAFIQAAVDSGLGFYSLES